MIKATLLFTCEAGGSRCHCATHHSPCCHPMPHPHRTRTLPQIPTSLPRSKPKLHSPLPPLGELSMPEATPAHTTLSHNPTDRAQHEQRCTSCARAHACRYRYYSRTSPMCLYGKCMFCGPGHGICCPPRGRQAPGVPSIAWPNSPHMHRAMSTAPHD